MRQALFCSNTKIQRLQIKCLQGHEASRLSGRRQRRQTRRKGQSLLLKKFPLQLTDTALQSLSSAVCQLALKRAFLN